MAIADVDALVKKDTPIDGHAWLNTTSVYTSARIFPMLPERLCTDLTSLNPAEDRLALVTEMVFNADASLAGSTVYRARVRNRAKLAYDAVSAWIDGEAALPDAAAAVPGMEAQLRTQDALAQQLRARRHALGSLDLETFQPRARVRGRTGGGHPPAGAEPRAPADRGGDDRHQRLHRALPGRAGRRLAAPRGALARALAAHRGGGQGYGEGLPEEPDGKALEAFLARQHRLDPLRFPDLSLVIVKLMGRASTWSKCPAARPSAISDWRCATTPTPPRPTAASPT